MRQDLYLVELTREREDRAETRRLHVRAEDIHYAMRTAEKFYVGFKAESTRRVGNVQG